MYKKAINKTKKTLKEYGVSFKEYMRDCGRRDDIDLGDIVVNENKKIRGIIVGWNGGCNYNVFIFDRNDIYNIHPSSVQKEDIKIERVEK